MQLTKKCHKASRNVCSRFHFDMAKLYGNFFPIIALDLFESPFRIGNCKTGETVVLNHENLWQIVQNSSINSNEKVKLWNTISQHERDPLSLHSDLLNLILDNSIYQLSKKKVRPIFFVALPEMFSNSNKNFFREAMEESKNAPYQLWFISTLLAAAWGVSKNSISSLAHPRQCIVYQGKYFTSIGIFFAGGITNQKVHRTQLSRKSILLECKSILEDSEKESLPEYFNQIKVKAKNLDSLWRAKPRDKIKLISYSELGSVENHFSHQFDQTSELMVNCLMVCARKTFGLT